MPAYTVIDSAQQGGFYKRLDKHGVEYCSLFEGFAEANLPEIAPLLVLNPQPGAMQSQRISPEIEQLAQRRPAVSVVQSELSLNDLAVHLRQFHTVRIPGRKTMILRWYDTRILPRWLEVLTTSQRFGFVDGISSWTLRDRFGDEVVLNLPGDGPHIAPLPPYELDEAQCAQLLQSGETDRLIAHLRNVIRDELDQTEYRHLYRFVDMQLNLARAHGIESLDDQTQFLLLALYTSGHFTDHAQVQARLANASLAHEQPFSTWIETLSEKVWDTGEPLWSTQSQKVGNGP